MLREPDRPSSLSTLAVYEITKGCAIIAASFLQVANKLPAEAYLTVPVTPQLADVTLFLLA